MNGRWPSGLVYKTIFIIKSKCMLSVSWFYLYKYCKQIIKNDRITYLEAKFIVPIINISILNIGIYYQQI